MMPGQGTIAMTTTPLNTAQIADLQQLLRQRQTELEAWIEKGLHAEGQVEAAVSPDEDAGRDNGAPEVAIARIERHIARLAEVSHALEKFAPGASGSYGLCEACGDAIGYARLLVHPGARLCLNCQTAVELREGVRDVSQPGA